MKKIIFVFVALCVAFPNYSLAQGATTVSSTTAEQLIEIREKLEALTVVLEKLKQVVLQLKTYDQNNGTNKFSEFLNGSQPPPSSGQSSAGSGFSSNQGPLGQVFSGFSSLISGLLGGVNSPPAPSMIDPTDNSYYRNYSEAASDRQRIAQSMLTDAQVQEALQKHGDTLSEFLPGTGSSSSGISQTGWGMKLIDSGHRQSGNGNPVLLLIAVKNGKVEFVVQAVSGRKGFDSSQEERLQKGSERPLPNKIYPIKNRPHKAGGLVYGITGQLLVELDTSVIDNKRTDLFIHTIASSSGSAGCVAVLRPEDQERVIKFVNSFFDAKVGNQLTLSVTI